MEKVTNPANAPGMRGFIANGETVWLEPGQSRVVKFAEDSREREEAEALGYFKFEGAGEGEEAASGTPQMQSGADQAMTFPTPRTGDLETDEAPERGPGEEADAFDNMTDEGLRTYIENGGGKVRSNASRETLLKTAREIGEKADAALNSGDDSSAGESV